MNERLLLIVPFALWGARELWRRRSRDELLPIDVVRPGLTYHEPSTVFRDTPLLHAGDEQYGARGFVGEIFDTRGALYEHHRLEHGRTERFAVLHLRLSLPFLQDVLIHPRGIGVAESMLAGVVGDRIVEFESSELTEHFRVAVTENTDELWLRRLISPEFIVRVLDLAEHPLFRQGRLYVEVIPGVLTIATGGELAIEEWKEYFAATEPLVGCFREYAEEAGAQSARRAQP